MTQQVTISIPKPLYQRVQNLASVQNRPMDDVLDTAVSLAEATLSPQADATAAMSREEAAYRRLHPELMAQYPGQYVAIYQGQLVDHNQDELALLQRLNTDYPDEVVLMKQVRPLPEPELRFRSPRLIHNGQ